MRISYIAKVYNFYLFTFYFNRFFLYHTIINKLKR